MRIPIPCTGLALTVGYGEVEVNTPDQSDLRRWPGWQLGPIGLQPRRCVVQTGPKVARERKGGLRSALRMPSTALRIVSAAEIAAVRRAVAIRRREPLRHEVQATSLGKGVVHVKLQLTVAQMERLGIQQQDGEPPKTIEYLALNPQQFEPRAASGGQGGVEHLMPGSEIHVVLT